MLSPGAGWNVKIFRVVEYDRVGSGIFLETSENANSRDLAAAKSLVSALKAANLKVDGRSPAKSERHRDVQLLSGSGDPTAPIELTILFRPRQTETKGSDYGSKIWPKDSVLLLPPLQHLSRKDASPLPGAEAASL
jgi:hypothetical protein